jgi:hypothetical protein
MIKENFMDTSQDKAHLPRRDHITKGLSPIKTKDINNLPFKIKTDGWKEIKEVGKFPMTYNDLIDYD